MLRRKHDKDSAGDGVPGERTIKVNVRRTAVMVNRDGVSRNP